MRPEDQFECCLPPSSILGRGRKHPGRMPLISVALKRRHLSRSSRLCLQWWGESMRRSRVRVWSVHCASMVSRSLFCVLGRC